MEDGCTDSGASGALTSPAASQNHCLALQTVHVCDNFFANAQYDMLYVRNTCQGAMICGCMTT
jgi:hypothetical protein